MIYQNPYLILLGLIALSAWALWCRYREGRLLSPASGLHLQILIMFGLGGAAFALFPDAEPILSKDEILQSTARYCWPLFIGYGIAVAIERRFFRKPARKELVITHNKDLTPGIVLLVALLGFTGCLMEGRPLISGFNAAPTYLKSLFFPGFLIALINFPNYRAIGRLLSGIIIIMAIVIGIWSAWRSVLIILGATILIAALLKKPKWLPVTALLGLMAMSWLIPFQNFKKVDFESFQENPAAALNYSLNLSAAERWQNIGEFMVMRINYVRELVYVNSALEGGSLPLLRGKTYSTILYQLVPRILWPNKPEMGNWAGYDLPREVGLLQRVDQETSWAVNMFAEATYNYGLWCLLWFVPLVFLLADGVEILMSRMNHTLPAQILGNVAFFYFLFGQTSLIFGASVIVAILLVIKSFDLGLDFLGLSGRKVREISHSPNSNPRLAKRPARRRIYP